MSSPGSQRPRPKDGRPPAAPDAGLVQLLFLFGWVPTGIAALVSGIVLGLRSGDIGRAAIAVVGGTVVGWIAILLLLFTIGWYLEQHRRLGRPGVFESIAVAFGVLATIPFAGLVG